MSWSVSAIGKTPAIALNIEEQFAGGKCNEPEETVRQAARIVIAAALAGQVAGTAVLVVAGGSQSHVYDASGKDTGGRNNNLSIRVEPQGRFIE